MIKFKKDKIKLIIDNFKSPLPSCGFFNGEFTFSICVVGIGKIGEFKVDMSVPYTPTSQDIILERAYEKFNEQYT